MTCSESFNISLLLAYDGTLYFGWQTTAMGPSVEQDLQSVLEQILQHPVVLQAASRTDRGVHALGQVVNFLTSKQLCLEKLHKSLNALLPSSIVVLQVELQALCFHPTLDAVGKEYVYLINPQKFQLPLLRYKSWHVPDDNLDWDLAKQAACLLCGRHDFSAFCNRHEGRIYPHKIRELWWIHFNTTGEGLICISLAGNHFLYKMARNLVGTLVDVARKKLPLLTLADILKGKKRAAAGVCAPAHGLTLNRVFYKPPNRV
ncbi:MAG: tRNA pseudouridine(38-40) synthase TruA [Verrucomicrobia bacterium]|nr:tRNA pseudouridine(38-40) synthase TruA [Verrucomicrobiota bacterium]MBS0646893.1 tRNA pseudouridine(38-40) synthase TruA [Verrucomicrobiota bacterium]